MMVPEPTHADIQRAVARLRAGGCVAFPTETVFGLGADALNADAVRRLFELKRRPSGTPLTALVAGAAQARSLARVWPERATDLADRFWPGSLTIVLPKRSHVPGETTGGLETIGLRCPDHPVALRLLRAFGAPLATPSANRSGSAPPLTPASVAASLQDPDLIILDGPPAPRGLESTVIEIALEPGAPDRILRPGPVSAEELGGSVDLASGPTGGAATTKMVRVAQAGEVGAELARYPGAIALLWREPDGDAGAQTSDVVRAEAEPARFMAQVYELAAQAEAEARTLIVEAPARRDGAWEAVHHRLRRLAGS